MSGFSAYKGLLCCFFECEGRFHWRGEYLLVPQGSSPSQLIFVLQITMEKEKQLCKKKRDEEVIERWKLHEGSDWMLKSVRPLQSSLNLRQNLSGQIIYLSRTRVNVFFLVIEKESMGFKSNKHKYRILKVRQMHSWIKRKWQIKHITFGSPSVPDP